ncbi:MAG: Cytochrome c biogenesis ATP-binding export protein CcmA [Candidatus Nitrospira kreftii]|uniref:Cytochrome c biogenesis ATP-binding export protein CcmA n=1 Tax=Candidatus Nitrospira kreftii TaxID=2652173 RepID=A0A7S8FGH4_9BACT|nr:MAG: Cytochrome c biogenesis ATP-binding export protein CcmA [Candidatus Nitrospira kreftii]
MLQAVTLSCRRGERRLFSDLTVNVEPGTLLAVVGENGSGKTSLLRIFSSLLPPEEGSILWDGEDIHQLKELYSGQLTYIGHLNGIKDDLTPVENVMSAVTLAGEVCSRIEAQQALEAIGLKRLIHRLPSKVLSQGQKRRVALARLWLSTRPLWLLDEPFTSLDAASTGAVTQRLHAHLQRGGLAVIVTHQEVELPAERVHCLRLTG